ncbi:MAG TPA: metal/formaldehyde-sensitive transcriptional repressor [Dyella sp.]|nr:metal/formaldehyde-sensitive transcriptional repressor [Dyella sp.]
MAHLARDNGRLKARLKRIGGQLAAIERALDSEAECGDILHQLAAVRGAIHGLTLQVLEGHLREHVAPAGSGGEAELEPLLAVLRSYLK